MDKSISIDNICTFIKKNGERCQARKLHDSEFCYFHSPQVVVARAEARRLGGLRRHGGKGETGSYSIKCGRDVLGILEDCINDAVGLEQTTGRAKTIGYLCQVILRGFEVTEMENRLTALEEKVYGKH
jgi:hypothetical protein